MYNLISMNLEGVIYPWGITLKWDPVDISLQLRLNICNLIIKQRTTHNARPFRKRSKKLQYIMYLSDVSTCTIIRCKFAAHLSWLIRKMSYNGALGEDQFVGRALNMQSRGSSSVHEEVSITSDSRVAIVATRREILTLKDCKYQCVINYAE